MRFGHDAPTPVKAKSTTRRAKGDATSGPRRGRPRKDATAAVANVVRARERVNVVSARARCVGARAATALRMELEFKSNHRDGGVEVSSKDTRTDDARARALDAVFEL